MFDLLAIYECFISAMEKTQRLIFMVCAIKWCVKNTVSTRDAFKTCSYYPRDLKMNVRGHLSPTLPKGHTCAVYYTILMYDAIACKNFL